jgi:Fe-S cluster assembly protein SufD
MQSEHEDAIHINTWFVEQASESRYYSVWMGLYGGMIRTNLFTKLVGNHCESNAYGLFFANDHQLIDYFSVLQHLGQESSSDQVFKAIVGDEAVGVFNGRIEVAHGAQKTAASQTSRNILLSPRALVHAKPHLEIYADDVKCSHGATVGQVNEDALFYLRTRGIGLDEAKFLQLFGFANEIVEKILISPLKLQVAGQVNRRLRNKQTNRCDQCRSHCC